MGDMDGCMSPVHGQGAPTASRPRWSRPLAARVPDAPWGAEWQDALLCIAGTPRTWHPNLTGTHISAQPAQHCAPTPTFATSPAFAHPVDHRDGLFTFAAPRKTLLRLD